jgi:flagellar basal-body rod modification protein FlgD
MNTIGTDTSIYESLGLTRELESKKNDELVMEDFLELMVTELTHQDPFKPMENTELATQISQFATVSGIEQLNSSFSGLSGSLLSDQSLQAANLVGRDVLVPLNGGYLEAGGSIDGLVGLESSVSDLTVSVHNAAGELIREINMGTQAQGEVNFSWDGMMDNGEFAAPGTYAISAQAMIDGEAVAPYILTQARVNSVSIGSNGQGLALNLGGLGPVSFDNVAEIR